MKFKVLSSKLSVNGGFVNLIEGESKVKVFGVEKTTKHRFMIKTDEVVEIGAEQELDLGKYEKRVLTQVQSADSQFGHSVVTAEGIAKVSSTVWLHEKVEA